MNGQPALHEATKVFVVGAGTMGAGIAEVAARAKHSVRIFDVSEDAVDRALGALGGNLEKSVSKGKLSQELATEIRSRIAPAATLGESADAGLVIEAVAESLPVKRELFGRLEAIVSDETVLATNTSSLSITALANGLRRPERFLGMHFFNPVPFMRLVEVVSGFHTEKSTAEAVLALAKRWGKVPVSARSTPGFVVNRMARPFYGEALALLGERAAEPAVIDRCLRGAGFRMGPCELMDLIGHDVNFAVTESIFQATFGDARFAPSRLQRELVDAGFLGRKSGRGFFEYRESASSRIAATAASTKGSPPPSAKGFPPPSATRVVLHGTGAVVERWSKALAKAGRSFERRENSGFSGLVADGAALRLTDGRPAGAVAAHTGVADTALFDLPLSGDAVSEPPALAWSTARTASDKWQTLAPEWLTAAGFRPQRVGDAAGLVVGRTVAMLINEAADAVLEEVCDAAAADMAMKLGMNFPAGPFEWLETWHAGDVVVLLDHLDDVYRGARYRVSPELRRRAWSSLRRRD
jgi:3-hydroxybutyryl-CoA dehydrogenase